MKSYIKIPMLVGIIFEGIALSLALIMYFNQERILRNLSSVKTGSEKVFPVTITMYIVMLIVYVIYMLIMSTYEGSSARGVGIGMTAAWVILCILSPLISSVATTLSAGKGTDALAALSMLTSQISQYTAPFTIIASAMVITAIARFGVENEYREPAGINPAIFGQGYTPMQGTAPFSGYMPAQGPVPVQQPASTQNTDQGQGQ